MDTEAMVLADMNGVIRLWSGGAEKMFGYAASEAVGKTLDLIVPPEYREAHWTGFRRAVASGQASVEGTVVPFPAQHASGDVIPRRGRVTLIRGPQTHVVAAIVVFESLDTENDTERHRADHP